MKGIEDYIITIPDFPEEGVMFRDVAGLQEEKEDLLAQLHEMESEDEETTPAAGKNLISRVLRIVAMVLFIGGAVLGLAMFWMSADYAGWLNAVIQMGAIWVNAAVYGGLLLGLSEIIRLLERRP